jgi:hypothetical protein
MSPGRNRRVIFDCVEIDCRLAATAQPRADAAGRCPTSGPGAQENQPRHARPRIERSEPSPTRRNARRALCSAVRLTAVAPDGGCRGPPADAASCVAAEQAELGRTAESPSPPPQYRSRRRCAPPDLARASWKFRVARRRDVVSHRGGADPGSGSTTFRMIEGTMRIDVVDGATSTCARRTASAMYSRPVTLPQHGRRRGALPSSWRCGAVREHDARTRWRGVTIEQQVPRQRQTPTDMPADVLRRGRSRRRRRQLLSLPFDDRGGAPVLGGQGRCPGRPRRDAGRCSSRATTGGSSAPCSSSWPAA